MIDGLVMKNQAEPKKHMKCWGLRPTCRDFPGGAVVKNPPANAGDTGSSSGPGRFHMPQSNWAHVPQLLSSRATTTEARTPQQEKPPQWETHAPQWRVAPARPTSTQQWRPNAAKIKLIN